MSLSSPRTIHWSEIENHDGHPTGKFICQQHLSYLLRSHQKSCALEHLFLVQNELIHHRLTNDHVQRIFAEDLTGETIILDDAPISFLLLLQKHATNYKGMQPITTDDYILIANYDAWIDEDVDDGLVHIVFTDVTTFEYVKLAT